MRPDLVVVVLILLCFHVTQALSLRTGSGSRLRKKRLDCTDGSYIHDSLTCCLCGAGFHLATQCTSSGPRKCEPCPFGTFTSHPNFLDKCELCTSCSAVNANMEEAEKCTASTDAVCRCKNGHYCSSFTDGICSLCSTCLDCGENGVRVACTANNNTVCDDKTKGGVIIPAVVVPLILIGAIGVAIYFYFRWRRSSMSRKTTKEATNGDANELERQPFKDFSEMDISPHLADIAQELEWGDMKKIALRSNMSVAVDNCERNHQGNAGEMTLELLDVWSQAQGKSAPDKLIKSLRQSKKARTAEKIAKIMSAT